MMFIYTGIGSLEGMGVLSCSSIKESTTDYQTDLLLHHVLPSSNETPLNI